MSNTDLDIYDPIARLLIEQEEQSLQKPISEKRRKNVAKRSASYTSRVLNDLACMYTAEQATANLMTVHGLNYKHAASIVTAVLETLMISRSEMAHAVVQTLLMQHQLAFSQIQAGVDACTDENGVVDRKMVQSWERLRQSGIKHLTDLMPQTHIIHTPGAKEANDIQKRLTAIYGVLGSTTPATQSWQDDPDPKKLRPAPAELIVDADGTVRPK